MYYRFVGERRKAIDLDDIMAGACFLVGGAPSLKDVDLSKLSNAGIVSMAMNNAAVLFKPTMWVGADTPLNFSKSIVLDPSFMKFCYLSRADVKIDGKKFKNLPNTFFISSNNDIKPRTFCHKGRDHIWWKNVFMVSVQILYRMGFRRIYLVGCSFDISQDNQYAFESDLDERQIEYNAKTYDMIIRNFTETLPHLKNVGVEVISCTRDSKINHLIDYVEYEEAIEKESALIPEPDTINVKHPVKGKEFDQEDLPPSIGRHYVMALEHRKTILRSLPENGKMLEWGSGDSTLWFKANLKEGQTIHSIEHSKKYAELAGAHFVPVKAGTNATIKEEIPDVGSTDYVWYPRKLNEKFDVILVDGIVRNLCLLVSTIFLKEGGVVFLHDAHRSWYETGKAIFEHYKLYDEFEDYPNTTLWEGRIDQKEITKDGRE